MNHPARTTKLRARAWVFAWARAWVFAWARAWVLAVVALGAAACDRHDAHTRPGGLRDAVQDMESLATGGDYEKAITVANRILVPDAWSGVRIYVDGATAGASEGLLEPMSRALDAIGFDTLDTADRAEVEFARALTLLMQSTEASEDQIAELLGSANVSLRAARRAGGGVSLDAVHTLGDLQLAAAEAVRATIPEIIAKETGGPPPPPPPGGMQDEKDDSDPLEDARKLYLGARLHYVERLALEPRVDGASDAESSRANVELVIRRLRELDEIERKREEQQQNEDQQSNDSDGEEGDEENKEEQDPKEGEEEEPKEGEGEEDKEQKDPSEEDEQPPEDPAEDEPQESEEEQPTDEEEASDESEEPKESAEEPEVTENEMTAEEQQRLLERNRAYQEAGDQKRREVKILRKIPAKKDW